jgi:hypothetical protein
MKIYLDDIRDPKTEGWTVIRDPHEAMELIKSGIVEEISFDHDLGENFPSGADVAAVVEYCCYYNKIKCPKWNIHSANPVGTVNIENTMKSAKSFSDRWNEKS